MKAARKQQYNIWPASVPFMNEELKIKAGMIAKKKDESKEDETTMRTVKVPYDKNEKDSKTYVMKIKMFDEGTPEEFLIWKTKLMESLDQHGYKGNGEMKLKMTYSFLTGRAADTFVSEKNALEAKNKILEARGQTKITDLEIWKNIMFEITIQVFETKSGWRSAWDRQQNYMRHDLFMGKLSPDDFSRRLSKMNSYLKMFPVEEAGKKGYGTILSDRDLMSIMDRAKPTEWHFTMLAQGKEPRAFNSMEEQLNTYRQLYQADQQVQIMKQLAERGTKKSAPGKRKKNEQTNHNNNNNNRGNGNGNGNRRGGNQANKRRNVTCYNCGKKGHISPDCKEPPKNGGKAKGGKNNEQGNMMTKEDFKNMFQASIKEMFASKKDDKTDKDDEDELDLNMFAKFNVEGKNPEWTNMSENEDECLTNNFEFQNFERLNKTTSRDDCLDNNISEEVCEHYAFPFSKKLSKEDC